MERVAILKRWVCLSGRDLSGTRTFWATAYFKALGLAVFKGGVAFHLDFGVVDKEILATVFWGDKSVAFFGVEPFYITCTHITYILF